MTPKQRLNTTKAETFFSILDHGCKMGTDHAKKAQVVQPGILYHMGHYLKTGITGSSVKQAFAAAVEHALANNRWSRFGGFPLAGIPRVSLNESMGDPIDGF